VQPLVVLVDGPDIIDLSCPEAAMLEAIGLSLFHKVWLVGSEILLHNTPLIQMISIKQCT